MFRTIFSIVAGYLVLAIVVGLAFSVVLVIPGFAFQEGRRDVTTAWMAYTLVASFVAAVLGGCVTMRMARHRWAGLALAVLLFVLGTASAVNNSMRQREIRAPLTSTETTFERASQAVQPTAYAFLLPSLGAVGVLLGAYYRRKC